MSLRDPSGIPYLFSPQGLFLYQRVVESSPLRERAGKEAGPALGNPQVGVEAVRRVSAGGIREGLEKVWIWCGLLKDGRWEANSGRSTTKDKGLARGEGDLETLGGREKPDCRGSGRVDMEGEP